MKHLFFAVVGILLASCTTNVPKELVATGGSKADGVVELSYQYNELETPIVDKAKGQETAEKRCKAWGYKRADPFGGEKIICNISPGAWTSCGNYIGTIQYQCLDE